ncbi:MAG TPA: hypothetical protein DCL75_12730 [Ktedonobacter sp.]|nr:hypothetical protein [Ktedonobacter sp.]
MRPASPAHFCRPSLKLVDEGQIKVAIAATFPLRDAWQAHELSQSGHGRGRIVLHIAE